MSLRITWRSRSVPASGATVSVRCPPRRERRDQLLGEAVGADRRDRDLEPFLREHVHQAADPRIVGHARPDEPDAVRVLLDLPHRLPERLEAPVADRPVDLPLEAEPAAAPAPLPDLEQGEVPVLRVGRPEERDRPELVDLLQAPLGHHGRGAVLGPHLGDGAVVPVRDRVALRDVDARDRREPVQERRRAGDRERAPPNASRYAATISPTISSPSPTTTKSMNGATGSGFAKAHTPPIRTMGSSGRRSSGRSGMPAIRRRRSVLM